MRQQRQPESQPFRLEHLSFSPPEEIETTTTARSSVNGSRKTVTREHRPLEISMSVSPEDPFHPVSTALWKLTGEGTLVSPVRFYLKEGTKNSLDLGISYDVRRNVTAYHTHLSNPRFISVGDEVAPYCYASESSVEYDETLVPYETTETRREDKMHRGVSGPLLDTFLLALMTEATQNPEAEKAVKALEAGFPSETEKARATAQKMMTDEIAAARSRLEEMVARQQLLKAS